MARHRLDRWVLVVAGIEVALLLATAGRYGYHRDELYFIVSGQHPAAGYPDQPALIPLLAAAMHAVAPHSLYLLRLPSALAVAATTVTAALTAREVGGDRRAQLIAAGCMASSGFALSVGHFVSTTTYDLLSTGLFCWLVVRALVRHSGPALLAAGIVAGVGFEAKPQVALVAVVALLSVCALGPRWVLGSPWLPGAVLAALVLAAPYVVWQAAHGFPQLGVAAAVGGTAEGGRIGFIPFQLLLISPMLSPVWIAGLVVPFRRAGLRPLRFLPLTYGVLAVAYLIGNGKAYYLASLYPGAARNRRAAHRRLDAACPLAEPGAADRGGALRRGGRGHRAAPAAGARPEGQPRHGDQPRSGRDGRLAGVRRPGQRSLAAHPGRPAGEHGHLHGQLRRGRCHRSARHRPSAAPCLQRPDGFAEWGTPPSSDTSALVIGYADAGAAAPYFAGCQTLGHIDNGVGLDNQEQGGPLLLCRTTASWVTLWPHLTRLG